MDNKFRKLTDKEWRMGLTERQFNVLRLKATDPRETKPDFTRVFPDGSYKCAGCKSALFNGQARFECGCGWPAFDQAIEGAIDEIEETDGSDRTEVRCRTCDGHLGHVFRDEGFEATKRGVSFVVNLRYCINESAIIDPITVYVVGEKAFTKDVEDVVTQLKMTHYNVVCPLLDKSDGFDTSSDSIDQAAMEEHCLKIGKTFRKSDVVVAVMLDESYRYGRSLVEVGWALGQDKPVVVICTCNNVRSSCSHEYWGSHQHNIFFWHPLCKHVSSIEDGISEIKMMF